MSDRLHTSRACALPTSTTATTVIPSNVQAEPQSIRLATCLDRSAAASGAIASMVSPCFPWRKLLPLTERLALVEPAPGVGRSSGRRPETPGAVETIVHDSSSVRKSMRLRTTYKRQMVFVCRRDDGTHEMLAKTVAAVLICSGCPFIVSASAEEAPATLTFAARPPLREEGHSTTLSGHAFLIIGLKTNFGVKEEIYGFYPVKNTLKGMIKGPGMLKSEFRCGPNDDCGPKHIAELRNRLSEVTTSVTVPATLDDVKKVYEVVKQWDNSSYPDPASNKQVVPQPEGDYKLFNRNCIDFIAAVAKELGYPTPDRAALQYPDDFIKQFQPLVEAERKTRAAQQEAAMSRDLAAASEQRRLKAEKDAADAKKDAENANARAEESDLARQDAEKQAAAAKREADAAKAEIIPAGWVPCRCPSLHAQYGKWVRGTLYHPDAYHCPN